MKEGDIINHDGKKYAVIEVKKRVVKVRRMIEGGSLGYNLISIPKQKKAVKRVCRRKII